MRKIALLGALTLTTIALASCDPNDPITNAENYVTLPTIENFTIKSSIMTGEVGDSGILTIAPKNKNYRVSSVTQNGYISLTHELTNKHNYPFTLASGENTFDILTTYEEVIDPDSDILGPGNEDVIYDGSLTDDIDPIPLPGDSAYEEPLYLMFRDASWWSKDSAQTSVITYKDEKVTSIGTLGESMRSIHYNDFAGFNYWRIVLDATKVDSIQFVRTGNGEDWGARTNVLPLIEDSSKIYALTDDIRWYGDGEYAEVETITYDSNYTNDPQSEDHGIYTIYFDVDGNSTWTNAIKENQVYAYSWGKSSGTAWPGDLMTYNEDLDLYSISYDTSKFYNIIFNIGSDACKTADIRVPYQGDDVSLLATINSDNSTVTWSPYTA